LNTKSYFYRYVGCTRIGIVRKRSNDISLARPRFKKLHSPLQIASYNKLKSQDPSCCPPLLSSSLCSVLLAFFMKIPKTSVYGIAKPPHRKPRFYGVMER